MCACVCDIFLVKLRTTQDNKGGLEYSQNTRQTEGDAEKVGTHTHTYTHTHTHTHTHSHTLTHTHTHTHTQHTHTQLMGDFWMMPIRWGHTHTHTCTYTHKHTHIHTHTHTQGLSYKTGKFSFMGNSRARSVNEAEGVVSVGVCVCVRACVCVSKELLGRSCSAVGAGAVGVASEDQVHQQINRF